MPLRPVPRKTAFCTMSPAAPSAVMPLRPPVTVMPSMVTRVPVTRITSIVGSGPLIVAPGVAAASLMSLRLITTCSLQVPLTRIVRDLRSSPCLSAVATASPAAQSTVVILSLSRSLSRSLSESARA